MASGEIRIGLSGWRYRHWRGPFYPTGLQQRRELEFVANIFPSVEINGTFYSLQRPASFERWAAETPPGFLFALKGGRFITHMRKLIGVETALANFFASGVLALGDKIGPILWQLPPQLRFNDPARFAAFFKLLPQSSRAAARLARKCDERLLAPGRSCLKHTVDVPLRHAIEIRHESFATPAFLDLLRKHDIGLVVADTVEWPLLLDVTSDLVYCRLHGSEQLYVSGYEAPAIDLWARRLLAFASGKPAPPGGQARYVAAPTEDSRPRDVFVFFDNDAQVRAPFDAQALQARVAQLRAEEESLVH
jgi:uncharacterized protein YecE (DUF72 family)